MQACGRAGQCIRGNAQRKLAVHFLFLYALCRRKARIRLGRSAHRTFSYVRGRFISEGDRRENGYRRKEKDVLEKAAEATTNSNQQKTIHQSFFID